MAVFPAVRFMPTKKLIADPLDLRFLPTTFSREPRAQQAGMAELVVGGQCCPVPDVFQRPAEGSEVVYDRQSSCQRRGQFLQGENLRHWDRDVNDTYLFEERSHAKSLTGWAVPYVAQFFLDRCHRCEHRSNRSSNIRSSHRHIRGRSLLTPLHFFFFKRQEPGPTERGVLGRSVH